MSTSEENPVEIKTVLAGRTRSDIVLMDIDNLFHHPANPRKDIGDIEELTDSIRENGVMQNLTIIPQQFWDDTWDEDDVEEIKKDVEHDLAIDNVGMFFYVLIGNRRFEASKAAGLEKLPCRIVYGLSKDKQLGLMLAENIQRSDLTIPEQAYGFQQMLDLGEDVDSISDMTGFSKSTIYHRLNIAKLDKAAVEDAINNHQLNMNDFIKLEGIDDEEERNKIIKNYPTQIDYRVNLYKSEKAKEKWQKEIFSKLQQEFLVEKFPEDARTWDKCWNLIIRLAVGEEVELGIFEKKDIFYTTDWSGGLTLYQYDEEAAELAKSEAAKPSEFDEQRKAREAIDKVKEILDKLKEKGIENILALRGDIPEDGGVMQYKHAAELIEEIRQSGDFCIGAACYPEGHPESADKNEDLKYLKEKVDSGVDFLTTQMFFQNELFYRFLYRIREIGITVPVCAGIMPVTSSRQLKRIGGMSGAFMPQNFIAMVDRFGGSAEAMKQAGIQYAASQIIDLLANGIKHIHVYTMNRPDIAAAILENLSEIWEYEISRSAQ